MRRSLTRFVGALTLAAVPLGAQQTAKPQSCLDRPLANWNKPAQPVPRATSSDEPRSELQKRCQIPLRQGTAAERAVTDAGWIPYLHFDRQLFNGPGYRLCRDEPYPDTVTTARPGVHGDDTAGWLDFAWRSTRKRTARSEDRQQSRSSVLP